MLNLFREIVIGFNWFVFGYFLLLNLFYFVLLAIAARELWENDRRRKVEQGLALPPEFAKPFSILVPAHNEETSIVTSVRSLLSLDYPEYEVIVCNDGSDDRTLAVLTEAFDLVPVDVEHEARYPSAAYRAVYFSRREARLAVVDKERGGKADAENAAACLARYPYVCSVDADSILATDSMRKLMSRFVAAPQTAAAGGIVRVANGCRIGGGLVAEIGLPARVLERIQVVEYLRAFLFGRLGWSRMNILMIISGAFGVFRQDLAERVGGWRKEAIGEDMDLVVRIQRMIHEERLRFRVGFVPDPICWTQVPDTLRGLSVQRDRWQRGLMQCLFHNATLLFNPRYGRVGMVGFPYFFFFEMLGAVVEFVGIPLTVISFLTGLVDGAFFLLFLGVAAVWGLCLSFASVALAEMSYPRFPGWKAFFQLHTAAVWETIGYRQLHAFWRLKGLCRYFVHSGAGWGTLERRPFEQPIPGGKG